VSRSHRPAFVLVHGAWHDARVWDSLRAALGREGARSVAVELPSDDVAIDASGYARAIARACSELAPDGPVVVGHSMAGIALPLVPALAPVRQLVFLAALVPAPGQRMADVQRQEKVLGDTRAVARDESGRSYWTSIEAAVDVLYHDCDPGQAREFAGRLRPQAPTPHEEPCPLTVFPALPTSYLLMREDRMIRPEWSRMAARGRLGVEPIELPGGHSPMLAQPEQLALRLIELGAVRGSPEACQ
jgi:pimeloyl-ACP methyl ester carboxylesterase